MPLPTPTRFVRLSRSLPRHSHPRIGSVRSGALALARSELPGGSFTGASLRADGSEGARAFHASAPRPFLTSPPRPFLTSPPRPFLTSPPRPFLTSSPRPFHTSAVRSSAPSHDSHYDPPGGWLFGIPPGEKYKKEGWEGVWVYGFFGSLALAVVAYAFKPDSSIQTWALEEARRRLEAEGILPDPEVGRE